MFAIIIFFSTICFVAHSIPEYIIEDDEGNQVLEIAFFENSNQVYTDRGSLSHEDLSLYEPILNDGFQLIGQRAQDDHGPLFEEIAVAKDIQTGNFTPAMVFAIDFEKVWDDRGGLGYMDLGLWQVVCPSDYEEISDLGYTCGESCGWPKPVGYLSRFRCIRSDLLVDCKLKQPALWKNEGDTASDGSVWEIEVNETEEIGLNTIFYYGNAGFSTPNRGNARCLKAGYEPFPIPHNN